MTRRGIGKTKLTDCRRGNGDGSNASTNLYNIVIFMARSRRTWTYSAIKKDGQTFVDDLNKTTLHHYHGDGKAIILDRPHCQAAKPVAMAIIGRKYAAVALSVLTTSTQWRPFCISFRTGFSSLAAIHRYNIKNTLLSIRLFFQVHRGCGQNAQMKFVKPHKAKSQP
jgi:hypothetical protein